MTNPAVPERFANGRATRWPASGQFQARPSSLGRRCAKEWRRKSLSGSSGSIAVEYAITASLLMTLLFGIFQTCFALYSFNFVSDAARAATRYAIVRGSSCTGMSDCGITAAQIQSYVRGIAYPGIKSSNLNTTTTWLSASASPPTTWTACANQCNAPGNAVKVQVTYAFPMFIPYWKSTTLNLTSTSQMVIWN
ncbi:MAG: TadE/TadG family type IV pilus assembly protein [Terracidiphilus sp.]